MLFGDRHKDKQIARGTPRLNRIADGSLSWEQPDSNGTGGWEGFCGQTATANLLTTHRGGVQVSPHDVSRAADDWTPGSLPSTLMRAIRQLAGDADQYVLGYEDDLSTAGPRAPIVCLLQWGGGVFHYVCVVGVRGGRVHFNHWGIQNTSTVAEFDQRWSFRGGGIGDRLARGFGGLRGYTSIRRR